MKNFAPYCSSVSTGRGYIVLRTPGFRGDGLYTYMNKRGKKCVTIPRGNGKTNFVKTYSCKPRRPYGLKPSYHEPY